MQEYPTDRLSSFLSLHLPHLIVALSFLPPSTVHFPLFKPVHPLSSSYRRPRASSREEKVSRTSAFEQSNGASCRATLAWMNRKSKLSARCPLDLGLTGSHFLYSKSAGPNDKTGDVYCVLYFRPRVIGWLLTARVIVCLGRRSC